MKKLFELTSHKEGTPLEIVRDDFSRRYSETHMRLTTKEINDELVFVHSLNHNLDLITLDNQGKKRAHLWADIISLEPWLPKSGYYQLPTICIYVERRPARQWKRSFSLNLYRSAYLEYNTIPEFYKAWKNQVANYKLDEVDEDSPTIRLSNLLAAGYDERARTLCIFFENTAIAKVRSNTKTIKLILPQFKQEITDYLNRNHLTHWKLVNE